MKAAAGWTVRLEGMSGHRWDAGFRLRAWAADGACWWLHAGDFGRVKGHLRLDDAVITVDEPHRVELVAGDRALLLQGQVRWEPADPAPRPLPEVPADLAPHEIALVRAARTWVAIADGGRCEGWRKRAWTAWQAFGQRGPAPSAPTSGIDAWCWQAAGELAALATHEEVWDLRAASVVSAAEPRPAEDLFAVTASDEALALARWAGVLASLGGRPDVAPEGVGAAMAADGGAALAEAARCLAAQADGVATVAAALDGWRSLTIAEALALLRGERRAYDLGRLAAALEASRAGLAALQAERTWDYEVCEVGGGVGLLGSHTTYYDDVEITLHDVVWLDLPNRFSHPAFRAGRCAADPTAIAVDIESDHGAHDAGRDGFAAGAVTTTRMCAPEGVAERGPAPGPGIVEALLAWASAPGTAGSLELRLEPAEVAPIAVDGAQPIDLGDLPDTIARPLLGLRLVGPDASEAAVDAALRRARARRGLPPGEPPAALLRDAVAMAARAVVADALGLPLGPLVVDPDAAAAGSRLVIEPAAFAGQPEAARLAHIAGEVARDVVSRGEGRFKLVELLPDPADVARAGQAGELLERRWAEIGRLATELARWGRLEVGEVRGILGR